MKRVVLSLAVAAALLFNVVHAQEAKKSSTRLSGQHKISKTMADQLPKIEQHFFETLKGAVPASRAQMLQDLRELEQVFPEYPFAKLLVPLEDVVKDEQTDGVSRTLAVLALDELHSDAGDAVIKQVANSSTDKGLQTLCNALLIRGATE